VVDKSTTQVITRDTILINQKQKPSWDYASLFVFISDLDGKSWHGQYKLLMILVILIALREIFEGLDAIDWKDPVA
jgi:hypothetical protein